MVQQVFSDRERIWPLLNVHLYVDANNKLVVDPSMDQLLDIFQAILDDFVDTLDAVPQLNSKRQLALYIDIYSTPAEKHYFVNLGQAVKDILKNNSNHKLSICKYLLIDRKCEEEIKEAVKQCYEAVRAHAQSLEPFLALLDERNQISNHFYCFLLN